ncbi:MAG TPA: FtsK/SpoIIIE domain-containing protein [Kribbella sp.]
MDLTLTTVDSTDHTRADRRVRLRPDASLGSLAESLGGPGTTLYLDSEVLDPDKALAGSGIQDGGVLGIDGPAVEPDLIRAVDGSGAVTVEVHAVSGPQAGRIWRVGPGSHEIGSDPLCTIRLSGAGVPSRGVWLTVCAEGGARWHRTGPVDGEVRGRRIGPPADDAATSALRVPQETDDPGLSGEAAKATGPVPAAWPQDEDLTVGSVLLRLSGSVEPQAAVRPSADGFGIDYNRPPRLAPHLDDERIRLPSPPAPQPKRPFPWPMIFAPLVLGLVMVGLFHSYYFLVFTVLSPVMMVMNWNSSRRSGRKQHQEATRRFELRQAALEAEIRAAVARERQIRNLTAPDPVRVAQLATAPGSRLWERRRDDPDHLLIRLGTADQPSLKELDDQSREENHRTIRWNIPDAPIAMHVPAHGVLGIAGAGESARAVARWLVLQAAVMHSPRNLRIVLLTEPERMAEWAWVRWLPHLHPQAGAGAPVVLIGNDEASTVSRVGELVSQVQARQREAAAAGKAGTTEADILVIADGPRRLRDVPGMVQVLTEGPAVGVYSVCADAEERLLPEECGGVVLVDGYQLTVRRPGLPDLEAVRADQVTPDWCEQVARALAPIRDVSPDHDAGLPREVRLLDLLEQEPPDAAALLARWQRRPASTSFVLGNDFDGPLTIDLVRDGPHGLVAGTTGSGKSELLQTLVASLAVANRPDELTFVLIDYKGGSAFKECAGLPHTLGMVTDLDAHLVERVLESLEAELRRRERVLAAAGAKDLPEHQAMRASDPTLAPLPRLLLVIDEFAAMVREVPDFVPGLIGIAQRGRSLGLHLVLATQRPAGVVTADIRANTNLRIALRVTDQTESQDVIDVGEAASIAAGMPGRALIRRGPRRADLFQTAWVGAERPSTEPASVPADTRPVVEVAELSWSGLGRPAGLTADPDDGFEASARPGATDLQVLVESLRAAAAQLDDFTPQPSPWQPALADEITLDELPDTTDRPLVVPYALEDLPHLQQRRVAVADLTTFGHLYVIGAPRSGRTQMLRTLAGSAARTLSCADLHVYGIDAGGGGLAALAALPHCGSVVSRHDMERLTRLVRRLNQELTERQDLAGRHNATGLTELRRVLPRAERPAHVLLLIDGWDALSVLLDEHDHGQLLQEVLRLLREGAGLGIHVIATSERSLLGGRLASHNDHKLLLRQADRTDYHAAGLALGKVPSAVPPGRGWHVLSSTETQVALLAPGGGAEQAEALRTIGAEARRRDAKVPAGRRPFQVAELPTSVEFSAAYDKVPEDSRRPQWGLVGLGGDDAGPLGVDLAGSSSTFAVLGPAGSGRSNTLAALAVSLLAGGSSLVVLTPRESPLRSLARHAQVQVLTEADPSEDAVRAALDRLPTPRVVIVDDADLLMSPSADKVLKEIVVSGRDHGQGLVFGASSDSYQSGMSGWAAAARRTRRGVLLEPRQLTEGELIGARLGPSVIRAMPRVGRGWMTGPGGTMAAVQIPLTTLKT